jgi:hypothetical protein
MHARIIRYRLLQWDGYTCIIDEIVELYYNFATYITYGINYMHSASGIRACIKLTARIYHMNL